MDESKQTEFGVTGTEQQRKGWEGKEMSRAGVPVEGY